MSSSETTFLHFDECFAYQKKLVQDLHARLIDFTKLRGTSLYCSSEAFTTIQRALNKQTTGGLTLLGSGNYHYTTLALLLKIQHPFTLILFDHHTDLNAGRLSDMLSCGSWVHHAISTLQNLKKTIIIGPDPLSARNIPPFIRRQAVILSENQLPDSATLLSLIPTTNVYISVDKDVLSSHYAQTNWDQGQMQLGTLCDLIRLILSGHFCSGMDICGEWPAQPHQHLNVETRRAMEINAYSNRRLAEVYRENKNTPDIVRPGVLH